MNKDFWERLNKLEELAGKATQGEWVAYASGIGGRCIDNITGEDVIHFPIPMKNGNYIAAANPAMIQEMIAEIRRLEKEADWLAEMCKDFCYEHNYCNECVHYPCSCPIGKEIEYRFFKYEVEDWRKEARKAVSEADNA